MRSQRSYNIAIAGISAALTIISLMLAIFLPTMKLAFFVISSLCTAIPLAKERWWASVATYVVAGLIGFFVGNIKAIPYILFFGLYALIAWLCDFKLYNTRLNKALKIIVIVTVKLAYFALAFWGCYKLMGLVISEIVIGNFTMNAPVFWIVGWVVFSIYDPLYRWVFKVMCYKISKLTGGHTNSAPPKNDDLFD